MSETREIRAMRSMAWERAKGELRSMLHTYYSDGKPPTAFESFSVLMTEFITKVEDDGLQE